MRRGRQPTYRKSKERQPNKLVLIVCEGDKTEPNYFMGLKQNKKIDTATIEIVPGGKSGLHPKNLIKRAINKKKQLASDELEYDQIWCVFDDDKRRDINDLLADAKAEKLNVAFSNPCFELWYLLHFKEQNSEIRGYKAVEKKLKTGIPKYEKSLPGVYNKLLPKQGIAIERAIALRERHKKNRNPETSNPSTSVDKLVKYLNSLERK